MAGLLAGGVDWILGIRKDKAQDLKSMDAVHVVNATTMRINYIAMDWADRANR